jgi:hypothetical protein
MREKKRVGRTLYWTSQTEEDFNTVILQLPEKFIAM